MALFVAHTEKEEGYFALVGVAVPSVTSQRDALSLWKIKQEEIQHSAKQL